MDKAKVQEAIDSLENLAVVPTETIQTLRDLAAEWEKCCAPKAAAAPKPVAAPAPKPTPVAETPKPATPKPTSF